MAILVKLVAVDAVFAAAREDLSSRQLKQAAYSLIIALALLDRVAQNNL